MLVPYEETQALGFPNSPHKLGLYEKPCACISSYGPCTQLVNSNYVLLHHSVDTHGTKDHFQVNYIHTYIYIYVENNRRSLNQRKTRKFNKIKYRPKRVTSGEKKKSTTRQVGNSEYQLFRGRHLPRETPSASNRESSAERPRSHERDQQSTYNTNIAITTRRPTYADILSRPKGQSHQNRTRSQFGFQQRQQREQRQRENRSVQFQDATSEEWNEDKPRSWVKKNDQTASVDNRGVEQLLEQALQGIQQNTQAIARLEENLSSFAPYRIHQEKW